MLACEINRLVVVGSVQQSPFKVVQSFDRRPSPGVEDAARVNQDVTMIGEHNTRVQVLDSNIVSRSAAVPFRANHLVLRVTVLCETVLLAEEVEVLEDVL